MKGPPVFQIRDSESGLSLVLDRDQRPRDPRLVENNVFQIVTWTSGLGDPHVWKSPRALLAAFPADRTAIFPLKEIRLKQGRSLVRSWSNGDRIAGYAFAPDEAVCMAFGLAEITPDIRAAILEKAGYVCMGELQACEEFLTGNVYRYEIRNSRGDSLEVKRDLYGEEHARHIAQTSFDQHLYGVAMDG